MSDRPIITVLTCSVCGHEERGQDVASMQEKLVDHFARKHCAVATNVGPNGDTIILVPPSKQRHPEPEIDRLRREAKSWHEAYVHAETQVSDNLQRALKAEELAAKRDAVLDEVNERLAALEPKIETLTKRLTVAERERDNAKRSVKAQNTVIGGLCRAFDDKMAGVFDVEALMARLGELVKDGKART